MEVNFKEFQESKKFMTTEAFNKKFDAEVEAEVGVFTYGDTSMHIEINNNGFYLCVGFSDWVSADLTELEQVFWDEFAELEYKAFLEYFARKN